MIDPTFKNELMGALNTAVSEYNRNPEPNAAVVKAAREHNFNVEQTRRLTETFNTARTLYQYEHGEKAAEFAVADSDKVLLQLFDRPPAAEKVAEWYDYSEYERPEPMAKQGAVIFGVDPGSIGGDITAVTHVTLNDQANRVFTIVNTKRAAAEHAEDVSRQVSLAADQCFRKIAAALSQEWEETGIDKYARLRACFKDRAQFGPIMARLHEWVPSYLQKAGEAAEGPGPVIEDRDIQHLVGAVKEAQALWQESCNLQALGDQMHKEASELDNTFTGIVTADTPKATNDPFASFFPKRAETTTVETVKGMPANPDMLSFEDLQKAVGGAKIDKTTTTTSGKKDTGEGLLDRAMGKAVDSAGGDGLRSVLKSYQQSRNRPMAEENQKMTDRLRNVQRQVILQDLFVNDPMISEADPEAVQNAYMAVMQMAPDVTTNKEVMRAILRHSIHSVAISPYDASSWVELEKLLQDVRGTRPATKQVRVER